MRALKPLILFGVGGFVYVLFEILWRGYSHWTMFVVGGLCFYIVGGLNEWFPWDMPIMTQMLASAAVITTVEFLAGMILNVWLGLGIWDYSDMPLNVAGQICVPFMLLWFFLSLVAIVLDDFLRYWWFDEQFPEYHFF